MSKSPKYASRHPGNIPSGNSPNATGSENANTSGARSKRRTGPAGCEQAMTDDDDDHAGLDVLYRELGPSLVRYLRRVLQYNSVLAEDIAQDAFLIMVRKWPDVRSHPCPKAYLYTVARHLAIDTLKERSREYLTEEPSEQESAGWIDPWDSENAGAAVREAAGKLPLRQREAVWLYYFCGFKQKEIATIMQIQRDTVAALLFQARKGLTGLLGA
jgi:RNA polymerase sigma-70 factor (ECF subfamily)